MNPLAFLEEKARAALRIAPESHPPRNPNAPLRLSAPREVLVVGGGVAGVAAATVLAERGAKVTLVEREAQLGGRVRGFPDRHPDGEPFEMERGFHGFFRQYYNLRALLRRVDPDLAMLRPLEDYPLLGPDGRTESFTGLPSWPIVNVAALVRRTESLTLRDLAKVPPRAAMELAAFDHPNTYATHDRRTAREFLESLHFPPQAKELLFDVFAHSFFNPDDDFSAAELLMMFHFYFMGNPEGLVFDVLREPFDTALWQPFARHLRGLGATLRLGDAATLVEVPEPRGRVGVVLASGERLVADGVVLAVDVKPLQRIVAASPALGTSAWREDVAALRVTNPFAVLRLWFDRPTDPGRAPFAGTRGFGHLDNISLYHLFEGESRRWAERTGGSVVELHAYGVPERAEPEAVKRSLVDGLYTLYPELRGATVLQERWLWEQDCPSFAPGMHAGRPGVETPDPRVTLAGDHVRIELPTALMERAATTGFLAASALLAGWGARGEPLMSVPRRGVLAGLAG